MKKMMLLLIISVLVSSAWSQLPDFDFSGYTAPEYTTQGLTLSMSPLLDISSQREEYNAVEHEYATIHSAVSATYFIELNRERWLAEIYATPFGNYSYIKMDDDKNVLFDYGTYISGTVKYYFSGKFYVSGLSGVYYTEHNSREDISPNTHDFDLAAGGGIGYGRIENINYIRRALYIIDELYESGNLTAYPDKKDLLAFGKLLCELDNERVYDSRLKRIENFKRIDSFLKETAILKDDGIEYFTILNDMLIYANTFDRRHGTDLNINYVNQYMHEYYDTEENATKGHSNYIEALYQYERALNRYWQLSASIAFAREDQKVTIYEESDLTRSRAAATGIISYYPDSRTSLYTRMRASYDTIEVSTDDVTDTDQDIWTIQTSVGTDYYISPQLYFSGGINYTWSKRNAEQDDPDRERNQFNLTLNISYDLF